MVVPSWLVKNMGYKVYSEINTLKQNFFHFIFRSSIFIPYLDSLISSLNQRFPTNNIPSFSISLLHPSNIIKTKLNKFKNQINV